MNTPSPIPTGFGVSEALGPFSAINELGATSESTTNSETLATRASRGK